ncbi:hypothetical protein FACS1894109_04860 [Spirochaetia bacterium]|nr:hypothetical protein FACS1894109_04860 [Spirochaetia bacterium]
MSDGSLKDQSLIEKLPPLPPKRSLTKRSLTARDSQVRDFLLQQGFLPAGAESYPLFRDFEGAGRLSELTPTVSTIWALSFNEVYKLIEGHLVTAFFFEGMEPYFEIKAPRSNTTAILLKQVIDTLYDFAITAGLPELRVYAVEESFLEEFKNIEGYEVSAEYSDDHSEYAYRPADIVNLSGGVNHKKNTHLNKFIGREGITFTPMTNENHRLCLDVEKEWCTHQDCAECSAFAGCELKALEIMADIYDDHFYEGLFGYVDGALAGFIIWEKRNEGRAYLHFGKGNIQNFFVYLIYILAKEKLPEEIEFLNINEDMGKEGLRRFKKHLGAHELWRKYLCIFVKKEA